MIGMVQNPRHFHRVDLLLAVLDGASDLFASATARGCRSDDLIYSSFLDLGQ